MSTTIIHKKKIRKGQPCLCSGQQPQSVDKKRFIVETKGRGNSKGVENAFLFGAGIRFAL
jgi:hypothetical protein